MDWKEWKLTVDTAHTARAADIALMAASSGIYIEDYSDLEQAAWEIAHIDLIDADLLKKDRTHSVIHLYFPPEDDFREIGVFLTERLKAEGIDAVLESEDCREEDWANNWKAFFKPFPVGEHLFVRPVWEEDYELGARAVLNIEPGAAFGTGSHDTTRLCLEALDPRVWKCDTVLDIGTGSGILAIASLLLGAKEAVGVDIDPLAVKTAASNGEMNGFTSPRLRFLCGDLTEQVTGRYTVVIANIVADVIIRLAQEVRAFMQEGAVFIASGIIDTREAEVVSALTEAGFTVVERRTSGGWVCLVMR